MRIPEKKISHHPLPWLYLLNGLSLKFGISVQRFLDMVSQVTQVRENVGLLLRQHGSL